MCPSLRRPIVEMNGDPPAREARIGGILMDREGLRVVPAIEEFLNGPEKARLAASIFSVDKEISGLAKLEVIESRTGKAAEVTDFDFGDFHSETSYSRPSIICTTSRLFKANSAA